MAADALCAGALASVSHALQRRIGLDLADEGYLWCGARTTAGGGRPIRDVQSYDPARYWWTASFMKLRRDDGILTLRFAAAAWEMLALFASLRLSRRRTSKISERLVEAVSLQVWMFPLFRGYDNAMPIFSTLSLVRLIERPDRVRAFWSGLAVGAAALVGRNYGLYATLATAGSLLFLKGAERARCIPVLAGGIVVGYSPLLALAAFDSKFRAAFLESLRENIGRKSTNLVLPIPWPWNVWPTMKDGGKRIESVFFAALPLLYAAVAGRLAWQRLIGEEVDASEAAPLMVGIPYLHYAYSRADLHHLATSIYPFFSLARRKPALRAAFDAATTVLSGRMVPLLIEAAAGEPYVTFDVGNDALRLPDSKAQLCRSVAQALERAGASQAKVFFAPFLSTFYPALDKEPAVYEISLTLPVTRSREERLIRELDGNGVDFVLFEDTAFDANEQYRMQNTHPALLRHILEHFERVASPELPKDFLLLRRAEANRPGATRSVTFAESSAATVAGSGYWRDVYDAHVWASPRALLQMFVPEEAERLAVRGRLLPLPTGTAPQILSPTIGLAALDPQALSEGDFAAYFALPKDLARGRVAIVELAFSHSFVPSKSRIHDDGRTLSVLLKEVALL